MTTAERQILNGLNRFHPLRRSVIEKIILNEKMSADKGTALNDDVSSLRAEIKSESCMELIAYNRTQKFELCSVENLFRTRAALQELHRCLIEAGPAITLAENLRHQGDDFWQWSFWLINQVKWEDPEELEKKDVDALLSFYAEYSKRVLKVLNYLDQNSTLCIVPKESIEPLMLGSFDIFKASVDSDVDVMGVIKKYKENPEIVFKLLQLKNWITSSSGLEDVLNLWLKFPECTRYMNFDLRQQISYEILDLLAPTDDYTISLAAVNAACEMAVRDAVQERSMDAAVRVFEEVSVMLQSWDAYRFEYQIVFEKVMKKCRRLVEG